jgi:hypothetical protein
MVPLLLVGLLSVPRVWPSGVSAADLYLASDSVAVGLGGGGSLINGSLPLGLLWDPDGADGEMPICGDILYGGHPFEGWSATFSAGGAETTVVGNSAWSTLGDMDWEGPFESELYSWLLGRVVGDDLAVDTWVALRSDRDVLLLVMRFEAFSELTDLRVARIVNPDLDICWGSYDTVNSTGDGTASAAGSNDDRALALALEGGEARICASCVSPDQVLAGTTADATGDSRLGVAVQLGDLAPGASVEVTFAVGFAVGASAAALIAATGASDVDPDGDGLSVDDGDCLGFDPAIFPGADEEWNGVDDDCDGSIDEDTPGSDDDGDGYDEAHGDCDDANAAVHPGAEPVPGIADADCDGLVDDGSWPPEGDSEVVVTIDSDTGNPSDQPGGSHDDTVSEGGGLCTTVPVPAGGAALLAVLQALLRRRAVRRSP